MIAWRLAVMGCVLVLVLAAPVFADCDLRSILSDPFRVTALDVVVDGNDLWLATSYGIELYDRSVDPSALVASLALPGTTSRVEPSAAFTYVASGSRIFVVTRAIGLAVGRSVDLGATIHDLLLASPYLYAATADGVVQIDLVLPDRPLIATRLRTTTGAAFSLARLGTALYAADGDGSVEVYTLQLPAIPQKIGTVSALPRTIAVHAGADRLFVSDGQQTDVLLGSETQFTRVASLPTTGAVAMQAFQPDVVFAAGLDRRLRAIDVASTTILFEALLPITSGNVNRILALAGTSDRIYAAAGDVGLLTFDLTGFRSPFPLRSYSLGPARSVVENGPVIFASFEDGKIRSFSRQSDGLLRAANEIDGTNVHDAAGLAVLVSSGSQLRYIVSGVTRTASFPTAVRGAVLLSSSAYVVLNDQSVWRADFSQETPTTAPVTIAGSHPSFIARDTSAIALADFEENGTTTIRYFASGDLSSTPQVVSIEGAATSGITVSRSGVVAGATFRGVTLVDFSAGTTTVLPQTNLTPTRDLHLSGDDLYVLTPTRLQVWSVSNRELKREFELPAEAFAVHRSEDEVTIASSDGLITVAVDGSTRQPEPIGAVAPNQYYRKVVAAGSYFYLFDGRNADVFAMTQSGFPSFLRRMVLSGDVVDIAATGEQLFTLSSAGRVIALSADGTIVADYQLSEGSDVQPLSIRTISGALYVAISKGCLSGTCEKKTLVLDSRGSIIVPSASLAGALLDVAVEQNVAYAIFDLPKEIRVLNISDPFHPVIISSRPSEGDPVSIAYSATLYTLGDRLYAYSLPSLSKVSEQLTKYVPDPTTRLGYFDQMLRMVSPDCAIVAGRAFNPELYQIVSAAVWQPASTPQAPSPVRSIATGDGVVFLLSDHSLEIWSSHSPNPRRRPARR